MRSSVSGRVVKRSRSKPRTPSPTSRSTSRSSMPAAWQDALARRPRRIHAGAAGAALQGVRSSRSHGMLAQPDGGAPTAARPRKWLGERGAEGGQRRPAGARRRARRRRCASCPWRAGRRCRRRCGRPRSRPRSVMSTVRSRSWWRSAPRVDLDDAHLGLAVLVGAERAIGSAPAVGRVAERAEQQRDVQVLRRGASTANWSATSGKNASAPR